MIILVIGGTGTMGRPLVELLSKDSNNKVFFISRNKQVIGKAHHLMGNALDDAFMNKVLFGKDRFDCIVDFMWYTATQFEHRFEKLLQSTNHYIGLSSGAVSADSDQPITEDMPRVIDICTLKERNKSHEYHMEKARIEDILKASKYSNWTLIRPHVTFNANRLPLFVWEKEQWLYRVLQGHTIILTKDMLDKRTVLTYGKDVANVIIKLIGKKDAFGEIVNITSGKNIERKELIAVYNRIFKEICNNEMKIIYLDNVEYLRRAFPNKKDRMDNDRMLNRVYDTTKLKTIIGDDFLFSDLYESLFICLKKCVERIDIDNLRYNDGLFCAYMDRVSGEKTLLKYFDVKNRVIYVIAMIFPSYEFFSYFVYIMHNLNLRIKSIIKIILNLS